MGIGDSSRRGCDNPRNIPLPFRHASSQKRIRMFEFCHLLRPRKIRRRAADEQEGQAVDRRVRRRGRQLRQGKGDKGHAVDISRGGHKKPHRNAMSELHMTWESTDKLKLRTHPSVDKDLPAPGATRGEPRRASKWSPFSPGGVDPTSFPASV